MPVDIQGSLHSILNNIEGMGTDAKKNQRQLNAAKARKRAINSYSQQASNSSALAPGSLVMGSAKVKNGQVPIKTGGGSGSGSKFNRFVNALGLQESSGNYSALGIPTHGGRAIGKYQIMSGNIPSWTKQALGHSVSVSKFRSSPKIQDAVARYKLKNYVNKYGIGGAAAAWYGGPGAGSAYSRGVRNHASQYGGPSIAAYVKQVLGKM